MRYVRLNGSSFETKEDPNGVTLEGEYLLFQLGAKVLAVIHQHEFDYAVSTTTQKTYRLVESS